MITTAIQPRANTAETRAFTAETAPLIAFAMPLAVFFSVLTTPHPFFLAFLADFIAYFLALSFASFV